MDNAVLPGQKMPFTIIHIVLTFNNRVVGNGIMPFIRLGIFPLPKYGEEPRDLDFAGA